MSKGRVLIKAFKPVRNFAGVKRNVHYMGKDSKQLLPEDKDQYFSRDSDSADYKGFIERVKNNRAIQHHETIKAFKFVYSLREVDYNAYLRSGKDYKDIVRASLEAYEKKHGIQLDWVAHVHKNEGAQSHPHCHVTIKSVSDTKGDRGYIRAWFKPDDLKLMREAFAHELDREAKYHFHERLDLNEMVGNMSKSFERAITSFAFETERQQLENENLKNTPKKKRIKNKDKDRGR